MPHAGRGGPSGHDKAALQDLLGLLQSKKMVLIDTTGVAPRDPRKDEIMDVLAIEGVQQLLVSMPAARAMRRTMSCRPSRRAARNMPSSPRSMKP
jgi:hypothetical protein